MLGNNSYARNKSASGGMHNNSAQCPSAIILLKIIFFIVNNFAAFLPGNLNSGIYKPTNEYIDFQTQVRL